MALDKILIGARVRKIREVMFEETREKFAKRCDLTERYIGQIERGEFLMSLGSLDMISTATGVDADYILYGKGAKRKSKTRENLIDIIDKCDNDELKMYYNCIVDIKRHIRKIHR